MSTLPPHANPAILPLLAELRARLLALSDDALAAAGAAANTWVASSFDKRGIRKDPVALASRFPSGASMRAALVSDSLELLEIALWLVEVIDRPLALQAAIAIRALPAPQLAFKYPYERDEFFETLVRARAEKVITRSLALLPLTSVLELARRGELRIHGGADEALDTHPELATGAQQLEALQATEAIGATGARAGGLDEDLALYLIGRLARGRHDAAVPTLASVLEASDHPLRGPSASKLLHMGTPEALEALAGALERGAFDADARTAPTRKNAILAAFLLDPRTAFDRLARFLRPELLAAEDEHSMVNDIREVLSLDHTRGHDGVKRGWYEADPRWAELTASMAEHPEWERFSWVFLDLAQAELYNRVYLWEKRQKDRARRAAKKASAAAPGTAADAPATAKRARKAKPAAAAAAEPPAAPKASRRVKPEQDPTW